MSPPHPHAEQQLQAVYLYAVIAVYGPWITSPVVGESERRLAVRRVTGARRQLHGPPPLLRRSNGDWAR
ncbi:hypothetical protein [Thermomonospora umbrina]|nr:hypothetical protein [Thermomonospora umbrina]